MAGMDARRIEHEIRALPGVVACQITSTTALVLVGRDADARAVNAAVAAILDRAAAGLTPNVLAAPPAPGSPIGGRRRRTTALAIAGSAAALSATVAAAAAVVVLGGSDDEAPRPSLGRSEAAAPVAPTTPSVPPRVEETTPRSVTEKLIDAIAIALDAPAILEVALPPALVALPGVAAPAPVRPVPDAAPPAPVVAPPAPELAAPGVAPTLPRAILPPVERVVARLEDSPTVSTFIAAAVDRVDLEREGRRGRGERVGGGRERGDRWPHGVARRIRSEIGTGPSEQAAPAATADGAKQHRAGRRR